MLSALSDGVLLHCSRLMVKIGISSRAIQLPLSVAHEISLEILELRTLIKNCFAVGLLLDPQNYGFS